VRPAIQYRSSADALEGGVATAAAAAAFVNGYSADCASVYRCGVSVTYLHAFKSHKFSMSEL